MIQRQYVLAFTKPGQEPIPMELVLRDGKAEELLPTLPRNEKDPVYISDGWIDGHAHVFDGGCDLGITADIIGYNTGVHLVVDAGSAGAINYPCFRKYVIPSFHTPVKVFLNIGRAGLVTKQPYTDERVLDIEAVLDCLNGDHDGSIIGIKVLSSGLIVERSGIKPLRCAAAAADKAGVPLMAHLVEGPPSNDETMPLLRKGDIITHCFHGEPNLAANKKAARGNALNLEFCSIPNVMWRLDGTPEKPLENAISRGVYLDVGHGSGSFDQFVARAAISAGFRDFSISTDAHIRSVNSVVHHLPHVMSKFLALGMGLSEVIRCVTEIPAKHLHLSDWCGHFIERATLFHLREKNDNDFDFLDSNRTPVPVHQVIEPLAIIKDGMFQSIIE